MISFNVTVRSTSGTYITNRVLRKQASCTAGPKQAVQALVSTLYGKAAFVEADLLNVVSDDHNKTHWMVHCDPARTGEKAELDRRVDGMAQQGLLT